MFKGTYTALITPFTEDHSVDFDALTTLVNAQLDAGIDGLIVLGTTGESPTISGDERRAIVQKVVELAKGKTQIVVGTGTNSTQSTVEESLHAQEDGADALLVVNPYYNKPTQCGLFEHFHTVAQAVEIPVILYNIAGRTGVNLSTPMLQKLAEHKNVCCVKEASGDLAQMMDVIHGTDDDFTVLSGDDVLTFPLICLGGHGVISVLSNLLPNEVKAMVDAALEGETETAKKLHYELLPLMHGCFTETNPIPIKTALAMKGVCQEVFRLPLCTMQPENREALANLIQ